MRLGRVALFVGAILGPVTASAHHSFALYDNKKLVTEQAVVKTFHWRNPHVSLDVVFMNDKGLPETWVLETSATNSLMRWGWNRNSLKSGDKITLTMNPMRDGSHVGGLKSVTLANGTALKFGKQGAQPNADEALQ